MSIQIPENMEEVAMKIAQYQVHGQHLEMDDVIKDAVRDTLQEFMEKVQRVTDYLKVDTELSVSIGKQWAANHKNLEQVVSKADEDMYLQKKEYYRRKQLDEC